MAHRRPVLVLRAPRRCLSARRRPARPRRAARRPRDRSGLLRPRRLEHVPRLTRSRIPATSPPRLRDRHARAPGVHRPLRFARRDGALRQRRRAMADCRQRHRALRDVPVARRRAAESGRAVPDLAQPARVGQARRPVLHDVVGLRHPAARRRRRTRSAHRGHRDRGRARGCIAAAAPAELVGVAARLGSRDLAPAARRGRAVGAARRSRARHRAHAVRLRGERDAHRRPRRRELDRPAAAGRRRGRAHRRATKPSSVCCCRAGRSASRSRSTDRS